MKSTAASVISSSCNNNDNNNVRQDEQYREKSKTYPCSLYPHHPSDCHVLYRMSELEFQLIDRIRVIISSLIIIGSVVWIPTLYVYLYKKYKQLKSYEKQQQQDQQQQNIDVNSQSSQQQTINQSSSNNTKKWYNNNIRQSTIYATLIVVCTTFFICGPHRNYRFGRDWIQIKKWKFITSWMKFIAMEVIVDHNQNNNNNHEQQQVQKKDEYNNNQYQNFLKKFYNNQSILAFVPHGIFPFGYGFGFLPYISEKIFGMIRPVVATATNLIPFLRDLLVWSNKVDASYNSVNDALRLGNDRIGINPGGIDEIFLTYHPSKPNTEYCIVRKGFIRFAYKYNIPVYPIYCFGATKMFRRLQLPYLFDAYISHILRISFVIFYGVFGLPIPYRQKLMYIIGNPIIRPSSNLNNGGDGNGVHDYENKIVDKMHQQFCNELTRIFHRHKKAYGWDHKSLDILTR